MVYKTQLIFSKTKFYKLILRKAAFFTLRNATKFGKQYWLGDTSSIGSQLSEEK